MFRCQINVQDCHSNICFTTNVKVGRMHLHVVLFWYIPSDILKCPWIFVGVIWCLEYKSPVIYLINFFLPSFTYELFYMRCSCIYPFYIKYHIEIILPWCIEMCICLLSPNIAKSNFLFSFLCLERRIYFANNDIYVSVFVVVVVVFKVTFIKWVML